MGRWVNAADNNRAVVCTGRPVWNSTIQKDAAMKGRFILFVAVWAVVLVAALAQTTVNPPPSASPSPSPSTTPSAQARPARVLSPSDYQLDAAGRPMAPLRPGPIPDTDAMLGPAEEAEPLEEVRLPDETGTKKWRIIPLLSAGVEYNDNIFLSPDRVPDVIWTIPFGLIYELGDFRAEETNYLSVQWIGAPVFYMKNSGNNAFNQFFKLRFQYRFNKLVMKLESGYSYVRGSSREVNTITTTQTFSNSLSFRYNYSDKTGFELAFIQDTSLTQDFQNTSNYMARVGTDYQVLPKTRLGLQGVAGVMTSSDSPLQYSQQVLAVVRYLPTEKLNFALNAGLQFLEFEGSDEVKTSPVFSLGLGYDPFPGTSLSLVGFRNVVSSVAEAGQDYYATGFELGIQQRLFQKIVAAVHFGYENDTYFETTAETPTNRVDDYFFVRPRLTYAFVNWFSVSLFYEFRQTTSTQESSNFTNNRVGMEVLAKF
jgi:Putative beta-barrel porin 2